MTRLSSLNISNNGFHSAIPIEFKNLSVLREVDLHLNKFTGGLSSIFPKDSNLFHYGFIDLSYNMFVGRIDNIGNLGKWTCLTLDLSNNRVINLLSLAKFDVSYNKLTGEIPAHTTPFPASSFKGNSGLCGSPLPPCKAA
ncbi:hypothetical protein MKX03_028827 [Papaver bracteatum]|nr:hypothetical protein MKX03_028827 [Papaver bracteatum]